MGEPSGEPEIEEDSAEPNCGKVRWIMNKGLGLGKTILVTGMVISSAPIVLPPLVVISAVGFALSVPSGVFLASYACSEKLMSKLLPYSTPPPVLENGTLRSNNEEEDEEEDEEQGTWVEGKIGIEKEEGWDRAVILEGGVGQVPKECEVMQERQEVKYVNNANTVYGDVKPTGDVASLLESKNAYRNLEAEKPIGEIKNVNNISGADKSMAETRDLRPVISGSVEDKKRFAISKEEIVLQGGREGNMNDLDFQLVREKKTVVSANADAREISDESRLYLFDEKNVSGQQYWRASYETSEGHVGNEGADFAALPVSRSARESTNAEISSGKDFSMHLNGVLYDEAKICRQLGAVQSIVGYKGTPHATCITEELKALYLFTGVEPPASFDDHPDLAQINDKLHFLMSIIGVKVD